MIHKAQVLIRLPGMRWVAEKQLERATSVGIEPSHEIDSGVVTCGKGDVAIKTIFGQMIDDGNELESEFVLYAPKSKKVIIAVFVGARDAAVRLDKLFPDMKRGEAHEADRAFLVVSPAIGFTPGWLLMPTGNDAHSEWGRNATPSYLMWLLDEARP